MGRNKWNISLNEYKKLKLKDTFVLNKKPFIKMSKAEVATQKSMQPFTLNFN